jgi:hypothetical protein
MKSLTTTKERFNENPVKSQPNKSQKITNNYYMDIMYYPKINNKEKTQNNNTSDQNYQNNIK